MPGASQPAQYAPPQPGTPCALCAQPIYAAYWCDPRGQYFCGSHSLVVCPFCERGFEPGGAAAEDRCPFCASVAVVRSDEAQARYKFVADWYGSEGLTFSGGAPPLRLESQMPPAPKGRSPMMGFADKRFPGFGCKAGRVQSIAIRSGLTRSLFGVVAAHELGHAYLTERGVALSERIEEGTCDWLAHAFALRIATDDMRWVAHRIEINPDPINGDGFRRVRALAGRATPRDLPALLPSLAREP
jgi:hypothetical protein